MHTSSINACAHIITFLGLYATTRKSVKIAVPLKSVGKYIFASTVVAIVLYLLPHPTTILATLGKVAGGVAFYAGLLLLIDAGARELVAQIWHEIKGILQI